jgi:hypothetical protein
MWSGVTVICIDTDGDTALDEITIAGQDKRRLQRQGRTEIGEVQLSRSKGLKDSTAMSHVDDGKGSM